MYCAHCGSEAPDTAAFCGKCGASLMPAPTAGPPPPLVDGQYGPGPTSAPAKPLPYDLPAIARPVVVLLWVYLASEVASTLGAVLVAGASGGMRTAAEALAGLLALAFSGVFVATGILFLIWQYRANRNCRAMGADLQIGPGWGVGAYFTPIICLYRPFHAMKEIWQASIDPVRWRDQPAPALLNTWWTLWIIASILGQMLFRMSFNEQISPEATAGVQVLSAIVDVFLCPVAVKIVRTITDNQAALISRTSADPW